MNAAETAGRSGIVQVDHATKYYKTNTGSVHALEDINLDIRKGEFIAIVGPSGCGKSTLLWAMSGLHDLTYGKISIEGSAVTGPRPEIGMIFQEANLLPWRNLRQNIEFPFEIKKKPVDRPRVDALLKETGLTEFAHSMPRELSGGMQQRASIVRALGQNPQVLLMDEPFGALDAFTRDEMNLLLLRLWQESGKTIVFVTHNISEAIFLADRVVVLTPRPGRLAHIYDIELPRPRTIEMTFEPGFIELVQDMKRTVETGGHSLLEVT
jgi:NitT/TauT family transport system ATP-binding protein